jgi:hypothetical protein
VITLEPSFEIGGERMASIKQLLTGLDMEYFGTVCNKRTSKVAAAA